MAGGENGEKPEKSLWGIFVENLHLPAIMAFLGHTVAGLLIFCIIALAALFLGDFVHWVQARGGATWLVEGLELTEKALFGVDWVLLALFLWGAIRAAIKELM